MQLSGFDTMSGLLKTGFGDSVVVFVTLIFVYVIYLEKSGMCHRIANFFLSRKIIIGRPWLLITFIFLASFVMGFCTYLYSTAIIMWAITYSICEEVGYKKGDKFIGLMVIGVEIATFVGYSSLPIKSVAILALGLLESTTNGAYTISFLEYSAFMVPMCLLCTFIYIALMRFVFKADVSKLKALDEASMKKYKMEKMNKYEKTAFLSLAAFIIMMCLPTLLPADWFIAQLFKGWGMNGPLFIVIVVLTIMRFDGKAIFDFQTIANSGNIGWVVIIMTACCFSLATAVEADEVGISTLMLDFCTPIFQTLSPAAFICIAFVVMAIATQFMHNLVLCAVMTPLLVNIALAINVDPRLLTVLLVYAYSLALLTPAASGFATMLFTNDYAENSLIYKCVFIHFIVSTIIILATFVPLGIYVYGI